mmetsp:Transcript_138951/g.361109  ORF Transcript_138951/g.361109 Transcript_138951/m.361109 type:complete len:285 (+) Transcript_138951:1027-1881(+)
MSARLVAAMTTTPLLPSKPSISVRSWFTVCSRSSLPCPKPALRCRPTASISSMKMMHGADFFASAKRSRTRDAPMPAKTSTNSEAETLKNGTPASPATALASNVLPVPGGPTSKAPLGIFAPRSEYRDVFFKKSTTSTNSSLAPSQPATSGNFTLVSPSLTTLAGDFPSWKGFWPPMPPPMPAGPGPPTPPKSSNNPAMSHAIGPAKRAKKSRGPPLLALALCITTSTFFSASVLNNWSSTMAFGTRFTSCRRPSLDVYWAESKSLCTRTISTLPFETWLKNSE